MNHHTFPATAVALAVFLLLSAVGRAQEAPARAYRQAQSRPLAASAAVAVQGVGWLPAARPVSIPAQPLWVPGHREHVRERVWVPGEVTRVWVPPTCVTRFDCWGRRYQVQVTPGYWQTVEQPGHYEWRSRRAWRHGGHGPCD